jgi:hypothetical protein
MLESQAIVECYVCKYGHFSFGICHPGEGKLFKLLFSESLLCILSGMAGG